MTIQNFTKQLRTVASALAELGNAMTGEHKPDVVDAATEVDRLARHIAAAAQDLVAAAEATTESRIVAAKQRAAENAPAGHTGTTGRAGQAAPLPGTDAFGEQVLALLEAQDGGGVFGESHDATPVARVHNSHDAPDIGDQVLAILEREGFGGGATDNYDARAASALAARGGRPVATGRKVTLLDTMNGIVDAYNARRAAREAARG